MKRTKGFLTSAHLCFVLLLSLLCSCGHINVISHGTIPVYAGDLVSHQTLITIKGRKETYLWGLVSPDEDVVLDEIFKEQNYVSVADVNFKEVQTTKDMVATVLSLGFYLPRHYIVTVRGRK